jgi:hypothetical protein
LIDADLRFTGEPKIGVDLEGCGANGGVLSWMVLE